jgi:putative membrane protein
MVYVPCSGTEEISVAAVDDPRVFLAAERTLLAWVRTGLSLMAFGFVVARFGLFLQEIVAAQAGQRAAEIAPGRGRASLWLGVALVAAGVLVNALAAIDHARVVRALRRGDTAVATKSGMGVVLGLALAFFGIGIATYLLIVST